MTFRGHFQNGVIVLDEKPDLADGVEVLVELVEESPLPAESPLPTESVRFKDVIGKAAGLPPDASINLDHYLYGQPKNE